LGLVMVAVETMVVSVEVKTDVSILVIVVDST
jgi:hypothetical protein